MTSKRIGEPLRAVKISNAVCGIYQNRQFIYAISSGEPCVMYVIDIAAGECVKRLEMKGSSHTWGISVTTSGVVYAGGDGIFYRYTPGDDEIENLGIAITGENYFWLTTLDDHDQPYCGTYPNGKVFRYEPTTGVFRDYGSIVEGEQYVRSMAFAKGKIYAGIGTKAHIIEIDPISGTKSGIPLPCECQSSKFVYHLTAAYPYLFAYIDGSIHIYNLHSRSWVAKLEQTDGYVTSPDEAGNVYYVQNEVLCRINMNSLKSVSTSMKVGHINNLSWIEYEQDEFPGTSLLSMKDWGFWIYNPATGKSKTVNVNLLGQPVEIQSLATGTDGTIYIGGYLLGGFASYNPNTDQFTPCHKFGQIENMLEFNKELYLGVYPRAEIFRYNPSLEWDNKSNPYIALSISDEGQDRPFAFTHTEHYLVVGTVPSYGALGGALTLFNPETNEKETFPHIVRNQSVISLTASGSMVFAGTSVSGGLGVKPSETEGVLFMFDTKTKRKVWEGIPVPGEFAVSALCVDDKGYVWGLTPSSIFRFDTETKTFDRVRTLVTPLRLNEVSHYWRSEFISYDTRGLLLGSIRGKLFTFNCTDGHFEVLEEETKLFTPGKDGCLFYAKGTNLYQYQL